MSVKQQRIPGAITSTDRELSIGAFARRSRLSMKALRLYARLGMLQPVRVDPGNGYRWYAESQLATARLIAMLRRLDMPLAQVAEVVALLGTSVAEVTRGLSPRDFPAAPPAGGVSAASRGASALVEAYWAEVERRVASQRELAAHLQVRMLGEEGSVLRLSMFEVLERDVPEQLVLTEQRHLHMHEMPAWLPQAMLRVTSAAQQSGGATGLMFVIYHGEVSQESDGPVEVCVPVGLAQEHSRDVATRREPSHREAYVRITKAQWDYPQIMSAYDAVTQWLSSRGLSLAGAPREIYLTDPGSAAPTDEVCDVAFPVET